MLANDPDFTVEVPEAAAVVHDHDHASCGHAHDHSCCDHDHHDHHDAEHHHHSHGHDHGELTQYINLQTRFVCVLAVSAYSV
jgi:hypothetical protein